MQEIKDLKKTIKKLEKAIKIIKEAVPNYENYKDNMGIDTLEFQICQLKEEILYYKNFK